MNTNNCFPMCLITSALCIQALILTPTCDAEDDWHNWSSISITGVINDDFSFYTKPEFRFNDDISNHYYTHIELGISWKVNSWFSLDSCYRHINQKKNDDWQVEYRPHLNATVKWKIFNLAFKNRGRLEYRIKEGDESFRYRNKLSVSLPRLTALNFQPYFAVEPFYDFEASDWNKYRVFAGVKLKLSGNFNAGIEYMQERTEKQSHWTKTHVLGTTVSYRF